MNKSSYVLTGACALLLACGSDRGPVTTDDVGATTPGTTYDA